MRMILAVMYREYRIRSTSMTWLFYDMFMPLIYFLLFGIGLNSAFSDGVVVNGVSMSYTAFFLAGVLSMACFGIAINTAYGFFVDRDNGIFYEFLTYPMTRAEFLIGKVLFNCLLSLIQGSITLGAAVLILHMSIPWQWIPALIGGLVFGTAGWFFFLTVFAMRIRRNDMFNTIINVLYFVLMFASSLFYPLESLPAWLRIVSWINPLTWHTEVLRFCTLGAGLIPLIMLQAALFGVFLFVSFVFAVKSLRVAVST